MLQETKLYRMGAIKLQNLCIFEKVRGLNEGGGLLTAVHENLKPVQIPVKSDGKISQNILVVEGVIGKIKVGLSMPTVYRKQLQWKKGVYFTCC